MRKRFAMISVIALCSFVPGAQRDNANGRLWTMDFPIEPEELVSTGRNPYFILEPGYQLILEGGSERLTITVLNETKRIDNVETRIVEERETKNGHHQEIAVGVAMDRAEIISLTEILKTASGEYSSVLKVAETTPLEPRSVEYKYYARWQPSLWNAEDFESCNSCYKIRRRI